MDAVDDRRNQRLDERARLVRHARQDRCAQVADAGQVVEVRARAGELVGELRRHAGGDQLLRHLVEHGRAEERAGDRQADGPTHLLEQRQAARGGAQLTHGHRVLHGEGEDREGRTNAQAGDQHPEPEQRHGRIGPQVGHQEQADGHEHHRADDQCLVAAGACHDLARGDGRHDQPEQHRQDLVAGLGRR